MGMFCKLRLCSHLFIVVWSPQFICLNLALDVMEARGGEAIRLWTWSLLNGINVLLEETPESPSPVVPHEDTAGGQPCVKLEVGLSHA